MTKMITSLPNIITRPGVILPSSAADIIIGLLIVARLKSCTVTSTARDPYAQAVAMYENCVKGTIPQYASPGRAVNAVYAKSSHLSREIIIERMYEEILRQGPQKVSNHCLPPDAPIWVVDLLPWDKEETLRFVEAGKAHQRVVRVLHPYAKPVDHVVHIEIKKA